MNPDPSYESQSKADLLKLVDDRQTQGVSSHASKTDLIAALELQDEQFRQDAAGLENLPKAEPTKIELGEVVRSNPPKNTQFTDGIFVMRQRVIVGPDKWQATLYPGEEFALCIHEPDCYDRTHSLKNSEHFWQGNESQFALNFEKK